MLFDSNQISAAPALGAGIYLRYSGNFSLAETPVLPPRFEFLTSHISETFSSSAEVHQEALKKYQINCDDFLLISGTVDRPEKIFLVERSQEPLKGMWWPLGGRAVNCPSSDSPLAPLWEQLPFDASLFLSIFRESRLQPVDLLEIREIGKFRVVFQNQPDSFLYNRDHPATLHAAWVTSSAAQHINLGDAHVLNSGWYDAAQIQLLYQHGKLLEHVKAASDAIFKSRFTNSQINLADFQI
jgi:hypothetical protein